MATWIGVFNEKFLIDGSAPADTSKLAIYKLPLLTALCREVSPSICWIFGFAWNWMRSVARSLLPASDARWRGVSPSSVDMFGLDPFSRRILETSYWFEITARNKRVQWSASFWSMIVGSPYSKLRSFRTFPVLHALWSSSTIIYLSNLSKRRHFRIIV